jgi:hypothetical protein
MRSKDEIVAVSNRRLLFKSLTETRTLISLRELKTILVGGWYGL